LKKKLVIVYNIKAPREIEITETKVPTHLPKKIPEIIKRGEPNPNSETQTTENVKNINKLM
jgi:hypothetical protein